MSFKIRKFSLDSSVSLEGGGLTRGRRGSGKKSRASLDEGGLQSQELNHSLPATAFPREQTIAEESTERADGPVNNNILLKHNKSFHKLFPEIPDGENPAHAFTCALQKDGLYQGKLFVSDSHVCFHSSVLLKDTKVVIPLSSVREVKKHHSAMSLTIHTADGEKYLFVSLMNRGMCYKLLQSVCSHAQAESTNSSPRVSSGENEIDFDVISTNSSMDSSFEHCLSRETSIDCDDFVHVSSEVHSRLNSTSPNAVTDDKDNKVAGWIWRVANGVASLFFFTEIRNLQNAVAAVGIWIHRLEDHCFGGAADLFELSWTNFAPHTVQGNIASGLRVQLTNLQGPHSLEKIDLCLDSLPEAS